MMGLRQHGYDWLKLCCLMLAAGLISACSSARYITASELNQRIQSNQPTLVIDARTAYEFNKGHIPGAVHIPFWKTPFINEEKLGCSGKTLVVHCAHGPRAGLARWFLEGEECPDILYLSGHISAWEKAGFKLQTKAR